MVVNAAGDRSAGDLTARARIRDAALRLFADRGLDGTTIRDIAKAAGVSGGLIRHHFGSKDELRSACDSYALDQMMRIKEQAVREGQLGNPAFMSAAHPTVLLTLRYLARSLVDGSPAAEAMYDEMVELCEAWLAEHNPGQMADPHGYSAVLVAMQSGLLMMHGQLSRWLGADIFTAEGHLRLTAAMIDFYSQPLLGPELADQARATVRHLQGAQPATERPAK
ncbi:MAG TPA: TetR family transcriptional regulator [Streptosporangiaceae bacterium]|nr:TetR family transcriptional regulator [Streptosporangiaceae bacterium]